jgi:hypothetical protein
MTGSSLFSRGVVGAACALACLLAAPAIASAVPEAEPNNTVTTAQGPIIDGTPYDGTRENGTDEDWYYFGSMGAGPLNVSVTITNNTSFIDCKPRDPDVCFIRAALRNSAGELLVDPVAGVSNFPAIKSGETRTLNWTLPSEGTYTVQVLEGDVDDSYTLTVTGSPPLISDPSVVPPPVGPPPPPPEDPGPPVKSCAQLVTELKGSETKRATAARLYSKYKKEYAKYKQAAKTKTNLKRKASALKKSKVYKAQVAAFDKQVAAGVKALTDAKCSCELLGRELGQWNASLKKDKALLKTAKKREKKATTIKQLLSLKKATAVIERRIRLARSKIISITGQRNARQCTT